MQHCREQFTNEDLKKFECVQGAPDYARERIESKKKSKLGNVTAKSRALLLNDPVAEFTLDQVAALKQLARAFGYGDALDKDIDLPASSCRELALALEQVRKFIDIARAGRGIVWGKSGIPGQRHLAS